MKKRFFRIVLFSYLIALIIFTIGGIQIKKVSAPENSHVKLNEIIHEQRLPLEEQMILKNLIESADEGQKAEALYQIYGIMVFIFMTAITVFLIYFYSSSVRPFIKMEKFAGELASGNLDFSLEQERSQMFGTFSWAFDHMRTELKEARRKEEALAEKNRTMIAEISHDIKTPVANIRNYCEGLALMTDVSPKRREVYLQTIMKKCDEVSSLTNDLFLHALNDMDRLRVEAIPVNVKGLVERVVFPLWEQAVLPRTIDRGSTLFKQNILVDERRFNEVIGNIVTNCQKYAQANPIEVSLEDTGDYLAVTLKDSGPGIPDEDMLYACQKFYRGANALNQQGAGLGLYISDVLMKQMEGRMELRNQDGLIVTLFLKKI